MQLFASEADGNVSWVWTTFYPLASCWLKRRIYVFQICFKSGTKTSLKGFGIILNNSEITFLLIWFPLTSNWYRGEYETQAYFPVSSYYYKCADSRLDLIKCKLNNININRRRGEETGYSYFRFDALCEPM